MEYRKIIDENGFVIDNCVIFINNIPQNFEMKDTYSSVTKRFDKEYIKPRWDGSKWIESATEEEIKAWQEENKIIKQPTTEEEMLKQIADLKIDNMKKDTIINNTLKTVAELKVKVMSMEGGN